MRKPDWEQRLMAFSSEALGKPFVWGQWDCVSVAARALIAMGGDEEKIGFYLGRWDSAKAAYLAAEKYGLPSDNLPHVGCEQVDPRFAQLGDILLVKKKGLELGHVCMGSHVLSAHPQAGISVGRLKDMPPFQAWRLK